MPLSNRCFVRATIISALAMLLLVSVVPVADASSTIFDGVISEVGEVEEKKTVRGKDGQKERIIIKRTWIKMRALYSPYSSVGLHASMQTRPDGTVEHLERRTLDVFDSFYIDDIPVTKEQIKPLLVKGARISTFENRSTWYFLRVVTRNHASQVGFLTGLSGNALTLSRPQMGASKAIFTKPDKPSSGTDADGIVNLHYG